MHFFCLRVILCVPIPGCCGGCAYVFSHAEGSQHVNMLPEDLSLLQVLCEFRTVNVSFTICLAVRG
jgi:hypothetical protein